MEYSDSEGVCGVDGHVQGFIDQADAEKNWGRRRRRRRRRGASARP
jgi:hypothetical protein